MSQYGSLIVLGPQGQQLSYMGSEKTRVRNACPFLASVYHWEEAVLVVAHVCDVSLQWVLAGSSLSTALHMVNSFISQQWLSLLFLCTIAGVKLNLCSLPSAVLFHFE